MLIPIHNTGHHRVGIGARADDKEKDEEEGLEVEEGGLFQDQGRLACFSLLGLELDIGLYDYAP